MLDHHWLSSGVLRLRRACYWLDLAGCCCRMRSACFTSQLSPSSPLLCWYSCTWELWPHQLHGAIENSQGRCACVCTKRIQKSLIPHLGTQWIEFRGLERSSNPASARCQRAGTGEGFRPKRTGEQRSMLWGQPQQKPEGQRSLKIMANEETAVMPFTLTQVPWLHK